MRLHEATGLDLPFDPILASRFIDKSKPSQYLHFPTLALKLLGSVVKLDIGIFRQPHIAPNRLWPFPEATSHCLPSAPGLTLPPCPQSVVSPSL